jgi:hypothetical protein
VPPCFDVYVWVRTDARPVVLSKFIDRYVDAEQPREPRLDAFVRTFIAREPAPGDLDALAELRRDASARDAFSMYLRAKMHYEAIITLTQEGDIVLGLGIADPNNDPETRHRASDLMASLREEFGARSGVAGVELPPPQSAAEWEEDGLVVLRVGKV